MMSMMTTTTRRPEPEMTFELSIRTAGLQMFAALLLTLGALAAVAPALIGATTRSLAVGSLSCVMFAGIAWALLHEAKRARILHPQPITLRGDHMVLPKGRYHQNVFQVQYDRVKRVGLDTGGDPRLTIELFAPGAGTQFAYSERDFASADDLFSLLDVLRRRVPAQRRAA